MRRSTGDGAGRRAYLFLFGTANPAYLGQLYRKRWTIEACFQNLKGRGFALRGRHLQCRGKLKKRVGTKSHDYKRASFSRHGLNALRQYS